MSETQTEARRPGRPSNADRAAEAKQQRRRRQGMGMERNLKLFIPEEAKDPNYVYRWVNDRPGRVQQLTKGDDYDVVSAADLIGGDPAAERSVSEGTVMNRVADARIGEKVVLLRKRKEHYEADRKEYDKAIAAHEDTMRRGKPLTPEADNGEHAYTPAGKNIINGR